MINNKQQLKQAIVEYYTTYYKDELGLPDWELRVKSRLEEETISPQRLLDWIETWLNYSFENKNILVVGGGTGAEIFALRMRDANVTAIEPNKYAVDIVKAKSQLKFNNSNPITQAISEFLPYPDNHFDFVYCFTVLERTQYPIQCIDEMIRVVKKNGWVFIVTPDYRFPYEPHYKINMPTILPKWMLHLWLKVWGRPTNFLDTLQFVNTRMLRNAFQHRPVTAFQVIHSFPSSWFSQPTYRTRLYRWIIENLGIQKDQYWLLQKLENFR